MPRKALDTSLGIKKCPRCKETKPLDLFHTSAYTVHGYSVYCKACATLNHKDWRHANLGWAAKQAKKWRNANKERSKDHDRKARYGTAHGEYARLYDAQQGCCAICQTGEPKGKGTFHIDHCHDTKVVRGLLCHHCNLMLGHAQDRPDTLQRAIEYLERFPKVLPVGSGEV